MLEEMIALARQAGRPSLGRFYRIGDAKMTDDQFANLEPLDLGAPDGKTTDRHRADGERAGSNGARRQRSHGMSSYSHGAEAHHSSFTRSFSWFAHVYSSLSPDHLRPEQPEGKRQSGPFPGARLAATPLATPPVASLSGQAQECRDVFAIAQNAHSPWTKRPV
ncbi:MAG: hypothetical protein ACREIF_07265 [Chthoniobacterales bacterium]